MSNRVLVAGDTGGLGTLFCQFFLRRGDDVRGLSRQSTIAKPENTWSWPHYCVDASDPVALERLVVDLCDEEWRPNVVLNCIGLADHNPILMVSFARFAEVITANLMTGFLINKAFGKAMLGDPEAIIFNFSSIHVPQKTRGAGSYRIAKIALEALTDVFGHETSGLGPRFICLRLPYVDGVGMANYKNELFVQENGSEMRRVSKSFEAVMKSVIYHIEDQTTVSDFTHGI